MRYDRILDILYMPEMVVPGKFLEDSRSKSPAKPRLVTERIQKLVPYSRIKGFEPFTSNDFLVAHEQKYVNDFFAGAEPAASAAGIPWSGPYAESLMYTNASLYHAIKNAISTKHITLSPTSGFHHATPNSGLDFCAFSGQAIASLKIWEEYGMSGCYIDLDAHFGNSIEDTRKFNKQMDMAVPRGFNMNPVGEGEQLMRSYRKMLKKMVDGIKSGRIGYVVFAHGADSHEEDDLGNSGLSTEMWLSCVNEFNAAIESTGKKVPIVLCLFGGYRFDDYDFVLYLHVKSITRILELFTGEPVESNFKKEIPLYAYIFKTKTK